MSSHTFCPPPAAVRGNRQAYGLGVANRVKVFVAGALRVPEGVRTARALFDCQVDVPESGWQSIADHAAEERHGITGIEQGQ